MRVTHSIAIDRPRETVFEFVTNPENVTQYGVSVVGATDNRIARNAIFSNADPGIDDLNEDGRTANDTGDADLGPNDLQNFPVLTSKTKKGKTTIKGTLSSIPNTTFTVQFFSNPPGANEGEIFQIARPASSRCATASTARRPAPCARSPRSWASPRSAPGRSR